MSLLKCGVLQSGVDRGMLFRSLLNTLGPTPAILSRPSLDSRLGTCHVVFWMEPAGLPRSSETPPSWENTVGLDLGSYGGPRGGAFSYERGAPVNLTSKQVRECVRGVVLLGKGTTPCPGLITPPPEHTPRDCALT